MIQIRCYKRDYKKAVLFYKKQALLFAFSGGAELYYR